jgi:hypothetical protein
MIAYAKEYATSGPLASDVDMMSERGKPCIGIRCGNGGDLTVKLATGDTVTVSSVLDGETLWIEARAIVAASTTARKLLVCWDS